MKQVSIYITRRSDKAVAEITVDYPSPEYLIAEDDGEPNLYNWQEGNYSCDCNRSGFFAQWRNEEQEDDTCGDKRFSVMIFNRDTGDLIWEDT